VRIADLCSGAGGAAMGLHQAFPDAEIVGVDVRLQSRYPFTFVQGDALEFDLSGFDFVWASPPCQEHTTLKSVVKRSKPAPAHHKDILSPMRAKLIAWGGLWIMENVVGAPLMFSAELCGLTFGLRVYRHRRFEAPFMLMAPPHQRHVIPALAHRSPSGKTRKEAYLAGESFASLTGNAGNYAGGAMGIDWMLGRELVQAIPPAYSRHLAQFIPLPAERAA
jgi:DNA (cytosine-5)-methyltransferase 1